MRVLDEYSIKIWKKRGRMKRKRQKSRNQVKAIEQTSGTENYAL